MATFVPIRGTQAQILATPIVDGQMLIETDQGNFNKIYLDVDTTRYQVGGHSGGTGSTLVVTTSEPTLYGKSVSVVIDGTTYTGTFNSSGTVVIDSIIKVGNATVTSTDGVDTATNYVSMPYYGLYTIALSFFSATVTVTFPHSLGAVCTLSDGTATLVATTSPMNFIVGNAGTWEATVTLDGIDKTDSVQITADGQTKSMTIEYGTINLTLDADFVTASSTITCVQGGTTISKTALSTSMTFYPPTTGNWTISGVIGADTFYSSPNPVNVTNLGTPVSADLQTLPNGQTVLPTDDIQIWLNCAGIYDKTTYTTLADVLADDETLQKLINNHNAVDYLVRSKSWITSKGLVPVMTSATTPSGTVTQSGVYSSYYGWKAFDGNDTTFWNAFYDANTWLAYEFPTAKTVRRCKILTKDIGTNSGFIIQGSNDNFVSDSHDLYTGLTLAANTEYKFNLTTTGSYTSYRLKLLMTGSGEPQISTLQFYSSTEEVAITEDSTTMQYIGLRDYAANTLLSDEDWLDGIASSTYMTSVLNVEVPTMTSDNTPTGYEAFASQLEQSSPYYAFNTTTPNGATNSRIATPPIYVGIKFPTTKRIYATLLTLESMGNTDDLSAVQTELQYSSDGNTWSTFKQYSVAITNNSKDDYLILGDSGNKYQYYRFYSDKLLYTGNTSSRNKSIRLQFYGREDIGTDYIYVTSAADDTITATPQGGGSAITITTDNSGIANVLPSNLPSGTYTFTSSVAKDPDNLNNYYSKNNINIFNGMIVAEKLMPNNSLYWYGYIDDNTESVLTLNGWGLGTTPLTFNTNMASLVRTSRTSGGIGTKNPVSGITKINTIIKANDRNINGGVNIDAVKSKYSSACAYYEPTTMFPSADTWYYYGFTPTNSMDGYIQMWSDAACNVDWAAFWYE